MWMSVAAASAVAYDHSSHRLFVGLGSGVIFVSSVFKLDVFSFLCALLCLG